LFDPILDAPYLAYRYSQLGSKLNSMLGSAAASCGGIFVHGFAVLENA
jgi:hypothetical protein